MTSLERSESEVRVGLEPPSKIAPDVALARVHENLFKILRPEGAGEVNKGASDPDRALLGLNVYAADAQSRIRDVVDRGPTYTRTVEAGYDGKQEDPIVRLPTAKSHLPMTIQDLWDVVFDTLHVPQRCDTHAPFMKRQDAQGESLPRPQRDQLFRNDLRHL